MARKAKHDQHSTPKNYVCAYCQLDACNMCLDIVRVVFSNELLCNCKRKNHSGEARDKQIVDPVNGTVYGPGLRVTVEGEVLDGGYEDRDSDTAH